MNIGKLTLDNPVILAPMAGVTDPPFRRMVGKFGPGLLCAEMVSANALYYNGKKSLELIGMEPDAPGPLSVQVFGSDPAIMAQAAQSVVEHGADIVDINMGCPVPKVVKNGEGAALMNNLPLAEAIIRAVVRSVPTPVTVKFRLGWDDEHRVAVELARISEACGAAAVAVHGRTREQFYHGRADWEEIGRVKEAVSIPVIGNGDVDSPQAAEALMLQTGCDGVMIGQACFGRPWIFGQVVQYLQKGILLPDPDLEQRFHLIREHLDLQTAYCGPIRAVKEMRKHFAWYFKGLPGAARMRERINGLTVLKEVKQALSDYAAEISAKG